MSQPGKDGPERRAPAGLLTVWGTLLHFDAASGTVCHASLPVAPPNLLLLAQGPDRLTMAFDDAGRPSPLAVVGGRLVRAAPGQSAALLDIVPAGEQRAALRSDGLHLCPEPDGTVSIDRSEMGAWECLAMLGQADLALLRELAASAWYSASNRAVLPAGSVAPRIGFLINLGAIAVRLEEMLAASRTPEGLRLDILHDTWRIERLRPFRPLVVFAAFGPPACRDALTEAMRALAGAGGYRGAVVVLTDAPAATIQRLVPTGVGDVLVHRFMLDTPSLAGAAWSALTALPDFAPFQPIVVLDPFVACDAPIRKLLEAALLSDRVLLSGGAPDRLPVIAAPSIAAVQTGFALVRREAARAPSAAAGEALAARLLRELGAVASEAASVTGLAAGGRMPDEAAWRRGLVDFRAAGDGMAAVAMRDYRWGLSKEGVLF